MSQSFSTKNTRIIVLKFVQVVIELQKSMKTYLEKDVTNFKY
jgi:hypothetical protein